MSKRKIEEEAARNHRRRAANEAQQQMDIIQLNKGEERKKQKEK